jgi:serine/threonine protein kinase
MATVFKGLQVSLNRPVAIKILHKKLSDKPRFVERFNRESLIIARLNHPNIIHVIDRGMTTKGMPYFVMDYVEGSDVAKILKIGEYTFNQKLDVIIQVCKALAYAHKNNIIHRDIKPANILIDAEGNALVADFGIAQLFEKNTAENDAELTKAGTVLGSLSYMSPEQKVSSKGLTGASDIYSLGVVIYEMFTNTKPLGNFKLPSEINPEVPESLEALILKCLATEPGDRYASADEIKDTILGLLQGAHIKATKKKEVINEVKSMEEIFLFLDVIKEHQYGAIYLVKHKVQDRLMVAKTYTRPLGGLKEAKLFTTLKHRNIVNIYGASGDEKFYLILMEYMSGGSLEDRLVRPHAWRAASKMVKYICEGLSFAHKNRIIHGNLRPSNILISSSGRIKLTDFGLKEHYINDVDKSNWYNTLGQSKSFQTDILSVGIIFYKMLTGMIPVLKQECFTPHKRFKSLPVNVQRVMAKMLTINHEKSYRVVDEVLYDIDQLLTFDEKAPTPAVAPKKPAPPPPEKPEVKRHFFRTLTLLVLLLFAVLVYLSVSGNLPDELWPIIQQGEPYIQQFLSVIADFFRELIDIK